MKLSDFIRIVPDNSYCGSHLTLRESEYKNILLYEGLISSVSRVDIFSLLQRFFPKVKIIAHKGELIVTAEIFGKYSSKETHEEFLKKLNVFGWFVSNIFVDSDRVEDVPWFRITNKSKIGYNIEPKYDIEETKLPATLYHVTPTKSVGKIQKQGLVPKSRGKLSKHPERVYVATTLSSAKELAPQLLGDNEYAIFRVNTTSLIRGTRFFYDPNYAKGDKPLGLYTLSNIPPTALTIVDPYAKY